MSIEDPSHNKQQRVVLFRSADRVLPLRKSLQREHEFFDVLSSPLSEAPALSDDEWQRRSVDNILALLEANAKLRALAVRLSDILNAAGMANSLDKIAGDPASDRPTKRSSDGLTKGSPPFLAQHFGGLRKSGGGSDIRD